MQKKHTRKSNTGPQFHTNRDIITENYRCDDGTYTTVTPPGKYDDVISHPVSIAACKQPQQQLECASRKLHM